MTPRRPTTLAAGVLALAVLAGCGSNRGLLVERERSEAGYLRDACKRTGLSNEDTQRAEALLAASAKHQADGDEEAALREAELAGILFRLALARRELIETRAQVDGLRSALAKDKDQLGTYQQVLQEVKAVQKP